MIWKKQWLVAADERNAVLHQCDMQSPGKWHIAEASHLDNRWEDYHEHHRPSALGRGPTANAAQHYAASGHEPEEEHRRFARDVVRWLAEMVHNKSVPHFQIFVASRFLGVLRREVDVSKLPATLHRSELAQLKASDLATHPGVLDVLNGPQHAVKATQ